METYAQREMIFSDYLRVIVKRRLTVLLITVLVTLSTYEWADKQKPLYKSSSRIKIQRLQSFPDLFNEILVSSGDPIENYIYEIKGYNVLQSAAKILKANNRSRAAEHLSGNIDATRIEHTDLINIIAKGDTANIARNRCKAVVEAFIDNHKRMISRNADAEYNDINKSLTNAMNNLINMEIKFASQITNRNFTVSEFEKEEVKVLAEKLSNEIIALQILRDQGNYTEEYPDIVTHKHTIKTLKERLKQISQKDNKASLSMREYDQKRKVLDQRKKILEEMVSYLSRRLEEAGISKTRKSEYVVIVEPARNGAMITTAKAYLTAVGGLLGLMLGIIMAFVAENLDTSIRTLVEIEETFHLPILGVIPHFSPHANDIPIQPEGLWGKLKYSATVNSFTIIFRAMVSALFIRKKRSARSIAAATGLIVPFASRSPATEGYRAIRTNMQLTLKGEKIGSILVASAGPAEGKSTTIGNLAFAFAQTGKKTLVIGGNMRRPSMYKTFGLTRERGLSEVLVGELSWREIIKDNRDIALGDKIYDNLATAPGMENLFFITSGGRTIHPAEWLTLPLFAATIRELEEEFDVILLDGTPVLPVPDSIIMSAVVKHVVLVYQAGSTQRDSMLRAISLIKNTGANISGMVLNNLRASWSASPDYFHYRGYYGRPEKR